MSPEATPTPPRDEAGSPSWSGRRVGVAGLGVTGRAVALALTGRGAEVVVFDQSPDDAGPSLPSTIERRGDDASVEGLDLIVASPGWLPDAPLFQSAREWSVPVWGEVDLAWTLQREGARPDRPWLVLTGTNGKTTTVRMLASMLTAAGRKARAVGNVGSALIDAATDDTLDVLAVELSSFQLHRSTLMRPWASAILNIAPDHVDWHGSMEAYRQAKGRIFERTQMACVYPVGDSEIEAQARDADVIAGCRAIGVTLAAPAPGQMGVVEDLLVDRAFGPAIQKEAVFVGTLADVAPSAPHNVRNALFAAALARSVGVEQDAVTQGLRAFQPDPHRIATVATVDGIAYIDDSKATNPHAAQASVSSFEQVVWIAGGLAKGAEFDELVQSVRGRLSGVVLLGEDRGLIANALARHAPEVPVVDVESDDTNSMHTTAPATSRVRPSDAATPGADSGVALMQRAVVAAQQLAGPGDTVLLAPACASMDRFANYVARGRAFADAVHRHVEAAGQ